MTERDIICHSEGHTLGIASNHGDVMHWFPRFEKSMDTFRAEVKALLGGASGDDSAGSDEDGVAVGDLVRITGTEYYDGGTIPAWVRNQNWYVREVSGDRAVIDRNESGTSKIMSAVRVCDLEAVRKANHEDHIVHIVKKGDTLWDIAEKYLGSGSRYDELKRLNDLDGDFIAVGQKQKFPN